MEDFLVIVLENPLDNKIFYSGWIISCLLFLNNRYWPLFRRWWKRFLINHVFQVFPFRTLASIFFHFSKWNFKHNRIYENVLPYFLNQIYFIVLTPHYISWMSINTRLQYFWAKRNLWSSDFHRQLLLSCQILWLWPTLSTYLSSSMMGTLFVFQNKSTRLWTPFQ